MTPKADTCLDRTIDSFVVSAAPAHMVAGVHVIADALGKKRWPVRLLMNGRAKPVMTRLLKMPKIVGAWLPYAPTEKRPAAPRAVQEGESMVGGDAR